MVWRSGVVVCAIPYNRKFARFDSASSHSVATLDKFLTHNCKAPERSNSHLSNLIIWWHNMSTGRAFIAMSIIIISIFTNKVLVHWLSLVIISELSAITTFSVSSLDMDHRRPDLELLSAMHWKIHLSFYTITVSKLLPAAWQLYCTVLRLRLDWIALCWLEWVTIG